MQIAISREVVATSLALKLRVHGIIDQEGTRKLKETCSRLLRKPEEIWIVDLGDAEIACDECCQLIRSLCDSGVRFTGTGPSIDQVIKLVCDEQKQARRLGKQFTSIIYLMLVLAAYVLEAKGADASCMEPFARPAIFRQRA